MVCNLTRVEQRKSSVPDTATEVRTIIARALRELEQVIDDPGVKSLLRDLGGIVGARDDGDGAAAGTRPASRRTQRAKSKPVASPRASAARRAGLEQGSGARANPRAGIPAKPNGASSARARSGSRAARASGPRAARASGRREQLLALIVDQPGITLAQAAKQFGVKDATGLYRVARRLQDERLVRKRGVELHPTAKARQQ